MSNLVRYLKCLKKSINPALRAIALMAMEDLASMEEKECQKTEQSTSQDTEW